MSIQIATKTIAEMLSRAGTFDLSSGTDVNSPNATTVYELGTYMNKNIYIYICGWVKIYFIIIYLSFNLLVSLSICFDSQQRLEELSSVHGKNWCIRRYGYFIHFLPCFCTFYIYNLINILVTYYTY